LETLFYYYLYFSFCEILKDKSKFGFISKFPPFKQIDPSQRWQKMRLFVSQAKSSERVTGSHSMLEEICFSSGWGDGLDLWCSCEWIELI